MRCDRAAESCVPQKQSQAQITHLGTHDINNKRKNDAFLRCSKEEGHWRYRLGGKKIPPTPAQFNS